MIGLAFGQAITLAAEIAAALMEAKAVENRKPLGQEATPNGADRKHITSGPKPQALVATASGHGVQPVFFVEKASKIQSGRFGCAGSLSLHPNRGRQCVSKCGISVTASI